MVVVVLVGDVKVGMMRDRHSKGALEVHVCATGFPLHVISIVIIPS